MGDLGTVCTHGKSFRARAEAREREYRANVLHVGWEQYGHLLDEATTVSGRNFLTPAIFEAVKKRADAGKGVLLSRTCGNMLSSQAMCFNLFAPLAADLELATAVLREHVAGLTAVTSIIIEWTPPNEIFGDQSGKGGVDCDVLVEGQWHDGPGLLAIETKFVEPDFSNCDFRDRQRLHGGRPFCENDVVLGEDRSACLYVSRKRYRYWERTRETNTLVRTALPSVGCPFGGSLWQIWLNHTLVTAEAARRGLSRAAFAVVAPSANEKLAAQQRLARFREYLRDPATLPFIPVEAIAATLRRLSRTPSENTWAEAFATRYAVPDME